MATKTEANIPFSFSSFLETPYITDVRVVASVCSLCNTGSGMFGTIVTLGTKASASYGRILCDLDV